jgi:hypothetical protein
MKKLLALILCVMMFVSIIPTAAFAAYDTTDQRVWRGKGQIEDIIDALRTNVQLMYGSIAADTAVYQSVKSVDDMINSLADEMIKGYAPTAAGTQQAGSVIKDAVIAGLRSTIGGEVSDYLDKHSNEYYVLDKNGKRILDPSKYAGVFASALSGAVASDKAVAGIQSYMYYILQRSAYEQTAQQLADLVTSMAGWGNWGKYGFDDLEAGTPFHMPGLDIDYAGPNNVDGTMHGVNAVYQEWLTSEGMLGVDLNGDKAWDTGNLTPVTTEILNPRVPTTDANGNGDGKGTENAETAFVTGANDGQ